jgi:hypothetical protein
MKELPVGVEFKTGYEDIHQSVESGKHCLPKPNGRAQIRLK